RCRFFRVRVPAKHRSFWCATQCVIAVEGRPCTARTTRPCKNLKTQRAKELEVVETSSPHPSQVMVRKGTVVKEESLRQELLDDPEIDPPEVGGGRLDWRRDGAQPRQSSLRVLVPTAASVFKWDQGGALIEGIDEATIGLLDEHRLSIKTLGERYCTDLNSERPEHSGGVNPERATQVLNMIGPNELTPPPTEPAWKLFIKELLAPL
ncbi:unnamed protein product, partial [Ectocarpus sp. 12 AP-2014]